MSRLGLDLIMMVMILRWSRDPPIFEVSSLNLSDLESIGIRPSERESAVEP